MKADKPAPLSVLLDAPVFFMGFSHAEGISSVLFGLARKGRLLIYATREILLEADRNLRNLPNVSARQKFHEFLKQIPVRVIRSAVEAAKAAKVPFLVTLDTRIKKKPSSSSLRILLPREIAPLE
jgi:hypothetical protein